LPYDCALASSPRDFVRNISLRRHDVTLSGLSSCLDEVRKMPSRPSILPGLLVLNSLPMPRVCRGRSRLRVGALRQARCADPQNLATEAGRGGRYVSCHLLRRRRRFPFGSISRKPAELLGHATVATRAARNSSGLSLLAARSDAAPRCGRDSSPCFPKWIS
jgi:hypothetical protein